jgi:hypothetical protein
MWSILNNFTSDRHIFSSDVISLVKNADHTVINEKQEAGTPENVRSLINN